MSDEVIISDAIRIPMSDIELRAVRAQGSGGQNVNKVATAIHLRFDINASSALPEPIRQRLLDIRDRRIGSDGIIVIKAQEHRTQSRNRQAAVGRLRELLRSVLAEPKPRRDTQPPAAVKRRRIEEKRRRGVLKVTRGRIPDD